MLVAAGILGAIVGLLVPPEKTHAYTTAFAYVLLAPAFILGLKQALAKHLASLVEDHARRIA
jgi:hypothetical protein